MMFVFLIVLMIPLLATALYGQMFARDVLSRNAVERSLSQLTLQAESIISSLRQAQGDAVYLSSLRSLSNLNQETDQEETERWRMETARDFLVFLSSRPMYRALRYLDETGMEVVAAQSDGRTASIVETLHNRSNTDYFHYTIQILPGGVYVSSFGYDDTGVEKAPLLTYAMRTNDGGVVVIDLHAGWLLRNLPASSETDQWAIMDQNQDYLVYPDSFDPGQVAEDLSFMLTSESGTYETADTVYVYTTIHPTVNLPDYAWVMYRITPKSVLYAELTQFYVAAGGFALVGIIVAVALAYFMSHRLTKPLAQLEEMATAFGRDGILPELPEKLPHDEIGSLTRTFCDMAHELERQRRQEHRLIEQLINAQEEERKLIAYDLHDGLIQQMVGARLYLTNCRESCPTDAFNVQNGIQRGCDALTEAIVEGRRIIEGLRPAVLDDLGLIAAIEEVANTHAQLAGWELHMQLQPLPNEPEKSVSVTLFRILQEALNNALKHAHARTMNIHLHNGTGIGIRIHDDGDGFDPAAITNEGRGLGMKTMQERATLLGGICEIVSRPGQGTLINVWVPETVSQRGVRTPNVTWVFE
ncbi:MAG: HAMP domain-containing protein [Anaerolineae bacterium]|nr:HAMP domain-containing protein [Anaerolineae bacterium]